MNCDQVETRLEYVNGCLSPKERGRFESHLQHCQECLKEVRELTLLTSRIAALPVPDVSSDLAHAVGNRLRKELNLQSQHVFKSANGASVRFDVKAYSLSLFAVLVATFGLSAVSRFREVHEAVSSWLFRAVADLSAQTHLSLVEPSPAVHLYTLFFGCICCLLIPLVTEELYAWLGRWHSLGGDLTKSRVIDDALSRL